MNERAHSPAIAPVESDWGSRGHIQALVLIVVTVIAIYVCYRLVLPLLPTLVWALVLAVLLIPLHRRLESKLKRPSLAAVVSVLVAGLVVAVPATFVVQRLIQEAAKGAEIIKAKAESGDWRRAIEAQPRLAPLADWVERRIDLPGTAETFATWLTTTAGAIVKGSLVQVIGFCLTFYLLFFFLRDRQSALQAVRSLSPLPAAEMDRLFGRVADTIFATVYGTLAVAAMQGLLGGLMFWWLGLPTPLLWGVVMALLAVVPVLGAFVVWIPAALFLAVEGNWEKALILTVWGGLVVGLVDNALRPVLIGNRLKLHPVLAFLAVLGGLMLFGPVGLILGPVALTITTVLLENWRSRVTAKPVARVEPEAVTSFESQGAATAPALVGSHD